jgi:hypothetical protein
MSVATTVEQAICDILAANTAVTTLIGTRVYPNELPQGIAFPAVCFQDIDKTRTITNQGTSGVSCNRERLSCYASSFVSAKALGAVIENALLYYRGGNVQGVFPIDNRDMPKITVNEEQNLFCSQVEVYIWFNE